VSSTLTDVSVCMNNNAELSSESENDDDQPKLESACHSNFHELIISDQSFDDLLLVCRL